VSWSIELEVHILGNLKIYVDLSYDTARLFMASLHTFDLQLQVSFDTHIYGHWLIRLLPD